MPGARDAFGGFAHAEIQKRTRAETIAERQFWPEVLGVPADIVGIPPAKLFAGIADADAAKLFYDDGHLNINGQDVFTPIITPEMLKLNSTSISHP